MLEALNTRQSVLFPEDLPWLLTPIFLFCKCEIIQITQYIIHPPKNLFDSHPLSVQAVSRENCFFKKQTNTCNYLFLIFSIIKWYFSQQYGAICFCFYCFLLLVCFFYKNYYSIMVNCYCYKYGYCYYCSPGNFFL